MKKKALVILGFIIIAVVLILPLVYFLTHRSPSVNEVVAGPNPTEEYQKYKSDTTITDIYRGSLPCDGCDGVDTVVSLSRSNKDASSAGTFKLTKTYLGTDKDTEVFSGTWAVRPGTVGSTKTNIVVLSFSDGQEELYQMKDSKNLIQLDKSGNLMSNVKSYTLVLL